MTPAVMVSACGLIALGLDNQAGRMSLRLRELAAEFRDLGEGNPRRARISRQVKVLERRHTTLARALLLNYGALFAFVATSLLSLAQGRVHAIPAAIPLITFFVGVVLLAAMALFAIASLHLSRAALRIEAEEILQQK